MKTPGKNNSASPAGKSYGWRAAPQMARTAIPPKADVEKRAYLFDSSSVPQESRQIIEQFDELIQKVRPLNSRQLQQLPDNIRALSHLLTDDRASRRLGYMNDTKQLASYVRYYTWWNLVRLTRLFSNLGAECFPGISDDAKSTPSEGIFSGSASTKGEFSANASPAVVPSHITCLDLGSGPLTVVVALWLARPELRTLPLVWYCLDVSANSMILGEDIYLSLVAKTGGKPWKIIRVKGSFGTAIKEKAQFITCANMFNELDQNRDLPPEAKSKKYFEQLQTYADEQAKFLLVEPGVPKASRTLTLLRERFLKAGFCIAAPCTHAGECPMSGFKAYTGSQHKWCNFAFSTEDAPARLQKLSERAKLPKERATLAFISAVPKAVCASGAEKCSSLKDELLCRVVSDTFFLPGGRQGNYACSGLGLTLLTTKSTLYDDVKNQPKPQFASGNLVLVKTKAPVSSPAQKRDEKTGAVMLEV